MYNVIEYNRDTTDEITIFRNLPSRTQAEEMRDIIFRIHLLEGDEDWAKRTAVYIRDEYGRSVH